MNTPEPTRRPRLHTLPTTSLTFSEVGLGCWQLGGERWGRYSLVDTRAAIDVALERGVTLFDTAPVYGFGRSEEQLGAALGGVEATVTSKVGLQWDDRKRIEHSLASASVLRQIETSLERLRRERIEICILHWPDANTPLEETFSAILAARAAGKIASWGMSNFGADDISTLHRLGQEAGCPPEVLQHPVNVAGVYPPEHAEATGSQEAVLEAATRFDLSIVAFDVLARGSLVRAPDAEHGRRDVRHSDARFRTDSTSGQRIAETRERLHTDARAAGIPPAALAVRRVLNMPQVAACLIGVKNIAQCEEALRAV